MMGRRHDRSIVCWPDRCDRRDRRRAAIFYHLFIGNLERAVQARAQSLPEDERGDFSLSVVRRVVLTLDLLVFAALGYWLGSMFEA